MGGKGTKMDDAAMKKAFGEDAKATGVDVYRWGDDSKFIAVVVMEGKVLLKASKGL